VIVDVIDCISDIRRMRIAHRAACALIGEFQCDVREFKGVKAWGSNPPQLSPGEQYVVFLHSSSEENDWRKAAKFVLEREREHGNAWLCTYSGSASAAAEFAFDDKSPDGRCWRHAADVINEWDYDDDKNKAVAFVGSERARPPVEAIINEALGRVGESAPDGDAEAPATAGDDSVRHVLVNAVGPLLAAMNFASRSGSALPHGEELWRLAKRRIVDFDKTPAWIVDLVESCDADIMTRAARGEGEAFDDLKEVLHRIDAYARGLSAFRPLVEDIYVGSPSEPIRILWIEDEIAWFRSLEPMFEKFAIDATMSTEPATALANGEEVCDFDAIVLDLVLEGKRAQITDLFERYNAVAIDDENAPEGIAILRLLQNLPLRPPVFVLSALESAWTVRACTVYGAKDYFVKGANDELHLMTRIRMEASAARARRDRIVAPVNPMVVVGRKSDPLARLLPVIERAVTTRVNNPIVFVGEPGVGKRELAREAHVRSFRRGAPFVSVSCAGLAGASAEGELFGIPRGAAPGASRDVLGYIEEAKDGVLYFDKFDLMPPNLRGRVLSFVESRNFRRLGEARERRSDALCIFGVSVAGAESEALIGELFGRITPLELRVPSLRERVHALPQLADALVTRAARQYGLTPPAVGPDALQVLEAMTGSGAFDGANGNVRGLLGLLQKAIMFANEGAEEISRGVLADVSERGPPPGSAPEEVAGAVARAARITADALLPEGSAKLNDVVDRFEAMLVLEFIRRVGRTEAAKFFEMTPANFRKRLEKFREKGLMT